jgi:hypothetical protein
MSFCTPLDTAFQKVGTEGSSVNGKCESDSRTVADHRRSRGAGTREVGPVALTCPGHPFSVPPTFNPVVDRRSRVSASLVVGLNAVIVAVTDEEPRLLTVEREEQGWGSAREPSLPFGPLDPAGHRTLELGLRDWVREQTGLDLGYAEQLYTFGDRHRDPGPAPRARGGGGSTSSCRGRTADRVGPRSRTR